MLQLNKNTNPLCYEAAFLRKYQSWVDRMLMRLCDISSFVEEFNLSINDY